MKDKLNVIKIGGNVIDNEKILHEFLNDFAALEGFKILVHGGGKIATQISDRLNIPVELIDGRRITNAENLDVVTMVYAGLINKKIVAKLEANQCPAIGLSGADGNCISAKKRAAAPVDFGFVGDVSNINTSFIQMLLNSGITPVFSAICHDGQGQLLNTNADTIAAEMAIAFSDFYETSLTYCFEKNGVLENPDDDASVNESLSHSQYDLLKTKGAINAGMLPKLDNCFYALNNNVSNVIVGGPSILNTSNQILTHIII